VLLGTTGGVSWWPGTNRTSSSSALVVGDRIYIIDLGQGATTRLSEAFNSGNFINSPGGKIENGSSMFLENATALFFTHLHQDHTADYPSLLLIGPGAGLGSKAAIKVIGPSNRGQLDADKTNFTNKGGQVIYTDSADLDSITATPGIRQMTNITWQAFAQTINDMTLDNGYPDFRKLVEVKEIGGTAPGDIPMPVSVPNPNNGTCPAMEPFEVYGDDLVRVTAILVDHHQVFPSFAYRFDTADGSVVFSGDTGPNTNGNLQRLAKGADILVHEVIDRAWIDQKFGTPEPGSQMDALKTHMLQSHTTIDSVGSVATDCGVGTLVLNHIVPGNTPTEHLLQANQNFSGKLIIGEDLMQIGVGRAKGV
jgi:ribonuclease BN (tRNA processing enzyme)